LPRPGKRCAAGQSIGAIPAISPGGGCALPGLRGYTGDLRFPGPASAAPPGNLSAPYPPFRRVAAAPYPA
ncbi:hypothetical protein PU651_26460, partial [Klebsiella pneumoniae]|uniref:hypothetical protein n=1 Tax=Klebsiella pneumoniae TaxID=573 RepID=UPI0038D06A2A